ncbi:hypothetical protein GCM10010123_32650 [Pilimelia anulata]|uniref:Peptidase S1 domain-containing protein n=1 Tax=Pilimelia anulata TaxID=53371 RepID=A0A8J3FB62_9ACTN|nr:hypothetical protein GCM10010123_32650 [Pilimelia anulata]
MAFRIGSTDRYAGGWVANGTRTTTHPSADPAIVQLDRAVDTGFSPPGSGGDVYNGRYVSVFGRGATCTDQAEINCRSRYPGYARMRVTGTNGRDHRGGAAVEATHHDGVAAGGDSGGPMFARGKQVGAASTSDRKSYVAYTNITRYRSWIRGIAGV